MPKFNEFNFNEELFGTGDGGGSTPPPLDESVRGRVAWRFFDGSESYDLPINPLDVTMPFKRKRLSHRATTAGRQVTFEGKPEVVDMSLSGTIMTEEHYYALRSWVNKRKQIQITDDLGRKFWVYLKTFSPTRKSSQEYPWLMEYTLTGTILDRG